MNAIKTKEQYEWAKNRVEELLPLVDDNTPMSDPNLIELQLLSELVADYSEAHFSLGEPTLSDILRLRMYEMNLTQSELGKMLEVSPSRISEYFSGKSEPTLKVARRMVKRLNIAPDTLLA